MKFDQSMDATMTYRGRVRAAASLFTNSDTNGKYLFLRRESEAGASAAYTSTTASSACTHSDTKQWEASMPGISTTSVTHFLLSSMGMVMTRRLTMTVDTQKSVRQRYVNNINRRSSERIAVVQVHFVLANGIGKKR